MEAILQRLHHLLSQYHRQIQCKERAAEVIQISIEIVFGLKGTFH
jgi:hypothetical protein